MKRRNFIKLITGTASAIAVPSLALTNKQADNIVVRRGLPPEALRMLNIPTKDKLYMFGDSSTESDNFPFPRVPALTIEQHKKDMEEAILNMDILF